LAGTLFDIDLMLDDQIVHLGERARRIEQIPSPKITLYPVRGTTANRSRIVEVFLKSCPQRGGVPSLNHLGDPLPEP